MKQLPQYIILIIISFCIIRCGTSSERQEEPVSTTESEYYSNGFIKQEVLEKTDTSKFVQFYSPIDSGRIDSAYYYEVFRDTLVAFDEYILNKEVIARNVDSNVNGDSLEINLKRQKYFWISLTLKNRANNTDSLVSIHRDGNSSDIKIPTPKEPWYVKSVHDWGGVGEWQ
jgi:hypothetical protein